MKLNIIKGGKSLAPKIYIYGREGIGKTTFLTGCPSPLIIDFDGGAERYNVDVLKVSSTNELLAVLSELQSTEYRTIGIDTLEALERMIYAEICHLAKTNSIEKAWGGYGKGYVTAGETLFKILTAFSALIDSRKMPVLIGQCEVKTVPDPEGEFAMFVPRANKHLANKAMEWADIVGFATREKSAATGEGERVLFTAPTKRAIAKSRIFLPEQIDLSFSPIASALKQKASTNTEANDGQKE
jgi:hypothetical protein